MGSRNSIASLAFIAAFSWAAAAQAVNVTVVGTFGTKGAVVSIDGAPAKNMLPGDKTAEGVKLLSVSGNTATFEIDGERHVLQMGQHYQATKSSNQMVVLAADEMGHFIKHGKINGAHAIFLVDTGASMVAISADNARRMGLRYAHGERGIVNTANGPVPAYLISLNTVTLGGITLTNVEALVTEAPMPYVLLGMSFLNRTDMKRSGEQMTLTRRY